MMCGKAEENFRPTTRWGCIASRHIRDRFIGGHNAMMALYGEGHAHSQKAWDTLFEAVTEMNKVADEYKQKYQLNFSVLATPAEGLSGRFTRMDRRKYGIIPGVTDNDYYVNSFHVDVKEPITITEKIKREAPFHAITRGGHITLRGTGRRSSEKCKSHSQDCKSNA